MYMVQRDSVVITCVLIVKNIKSKSSQGIEILRTGPVCTIDSSLSKRTRVYSSMLNFPVIVPNFGSVPLSKDPLLVTLLYNRLKIMSIDIGIRSNEKNRRIGTYKSSTCEFL